MLPDTVRPVEPKEHNRPPANCWVEIDRAAFEWNMAQFRRLVGDQRLLMAVVKANAYGHGMVEIATLAVEQGANWLGVFSIEEGLTLRRSNIQAPILVLGPPTTALLREAIEAGLRLSVTSNPVASEIARLGRSDTIVHLKVETGTHRQGLDRAELAPVAALLLEAGVTVEGAYTHFADIEDTTEHRFAQQQFERFNRRLKALDAAGLRLSLPHTACSAATILFPHTHFDLVRVGIALYGLWPSKETRVSAQSMGRNALDLRPVMAVKTTIAQIKSIPKGAYVGYGRTFRTTRQTRLAVLPVGYADGYDRRLSNVAHVLIRQARAPIRGRICMNLTMVDVTDIPRAAPGDEVVLLGQQGEERLRAEDLAEQMGTINYEVVTRIAPTAPRLIT